MDLSSLDEDFVNHTYTQRQKRNEIIIWIDRTVFEKKKKAQSNIKKKKKTVLMDAGKKQRMNLKELLSAPPAII